MSRRIINIGGSFLSILPPDEILGADLYDWFDFTDNSTLSLTGTAINSLSSKKSGSTRTFVASGGARPTLVPNLVNGLQGARFDGVASFMQVNSSTALYNFLHDQSNGGVIITIQKLNDGSIGQSILANAVGGNTIGVRHDSVGITCVRGVVGQQTYVQTYNLTPFDNEFTSLINIVNPNNPTALDRVSTIINGVTTTPDNSLTNTPSTDNASQNFTLGRRPSLNDRYVNGDIAEIIISQNQPTPTQLTQIQAYLTAKYGTFPI